MLEMKNKKMNLESKIYFNNNLIQISMAIGLSFLGAFCMWLMWISVYMHQMNPLIQPILEQEVIENAHS